MDPVPVPVPRKVPVVLLCNPFGAPTGMACGDGAVAVAGTLIHAPSSDATAGHCRALLTVRYHGTLAEGRSAEVKVL